MLAASNVDIAVCYGDSAAIIADTAKALCGKEIIWSNDFDTVKNWLMQNVTVNDVLLFKGSRGMALERFADALTGTWFYEMDEGLIAGSRLKTVNNLTYRVYADHATLVSKDAGAPDVTIEAYVDGKPVTGIERSVFSGSKYTESVTFPDTLTNIRYCAFYKTNKLKTVSTPPPSESSTTAPSAPARTCAPSRSPRAVRIWAIAPSETARRWRRSRSPPPSARSAASAS